MKKKNTIIVSALSALFIIGGVAACKHGHHFGGFDEFDLKATTDRIASRLDLTEPQKVDLGQIVQEIAEKAKAMHTDPESRHRELADLIRQDVIDEDVVHGLIADKIARMRELADFATERLIRFHATLTPEQRETIASRIENRASRGCRFGFR